MKKLLNLLTLFIFIGCIQAETSEQTVYRSEFMFCNYNEGNSYQDVLTEQASYEQFLKENGLEYNRLNLQPIWDNDSEYDYVMWGNWPNGEMQYKEWGAYMNDYPAWAMVWAMAYLSPAHVTAGVPAGLVSTSPHGGGLHAGYT